MSVNVTATKTISFKAPYTGATFQNYTGLIMGQDGYVSGGETTDDGVTVEVEPVVVLQRGLITSSLSAAVGLPVPTAAEPWFLLASSPDDDPDSGLTLTVTADLANASTAVVVAFKSNGVWANPTGVSVAAATERSSDAGVELGGGIYDTRAADGVVTSIEAYKGQVVDPSGERRVLPTSSSNSAKSLSATPARPSTLFDRVDHIVLRQVEAYSPELKSIIGGALYESAAVAEIALETGVGVTRPAYFAQRGGSISQQWWAWGNGIALKIKGGPAGEAFGMTTLLSGGAISSTWIAGQRASDSAVLLLYVDGLDLKLVSFDPATGAQVDAPIVLDALAGQISHVRAVLDHGENLHIVFEHDEGSAHQVYYTKRSVTGAAFGLSAVTPRIINGSDTGAHDTWPSIGVTRHGEVTVAHIRSALGDEFGDLVIASIDQHGITSSQEIVFANANVSIDDGDLASSGLTGRGAEPRSFLNLRQTSVTVTPHDEVYVFTIGLDAGALPNYLLAYNAGFGAAFGADLINVLPNLLTDWAGYEFVSVAADVGEAGEIFVGYKIQDATYTRVAFASFATPLLSGRLPTAVQNYVVDTEVSLDAFDDLHVRRGPLGEFVISYMSSTQARFIRCAPYGGPDALTAPPRHPRDLYLGSWNVPKSSASTIDGHDARFEVFNTRSKKMNYPIVVGKNGDYDGFNSIPDAFNKVMREGGGDIVLRNGVHRILSGGRPFFHGGFSMRGEGAATIISESSGGFLYAGGAETAGAPVSATGNVITNSDNVLAIAIAGDIVSMDGSGQHVVIRNLGPHPATGLTRLLLEENENGAPSGTTATHHASGIRFENLSIVQTVTPIIAGSFGFAHRPVLRNIRIEGVAATLATLGFVGCIDPLIDGVDLSNVANTDSDISLGLYSSDGAIVRNVRLADGRGRLLIDELSQNVHLIGCSSDGADSTKVIYDLDGTRTTPVFMSSCEGRVSGSAASLAFLITNVGKRLRLPEGGGALELEDDNTRASTITDKGIKVSSTTHKEFNGASKDVVTDAVNQRVRAAGDTMTGDLVMGADIETGGATQAIGATGTDPLTRFNVFANNLDVIGSIEARHARFSGMSATETPIRIDKGVNPRSLALGWDSEIPGIHTLDMHGRLFRSGRVFEEDFDQDSTVSLTESPPRAGNVEFEDINGAGSKTCPGDGAFYLSTAAVVTAESVIKAPALWLIYTDTSSGFRARIKPDITDARITLGFWNSVVGDPNNDAAIPAGFKIVDGVVTFVWNDNTGTHTHATGITTGVEFRWYSFFIDLLNLTIQWHVSGELDYGLHNGYQSGAYGLETISYPLNGVQHPFVGAYTLGAAAGCAIDYISAWSERRMT